MSKIDISQTSPEIGPSVIRDILGIERLQNSEIFQRFSDSAFSNAVEEPDLQDSLDALIDGVNRELSKEISGPEDLGNELIDIAMIDGSRTVREAVVSLGTNFGTRQKEELSAYFNLLTSVDLSRAQHYVDINMYDKRLYDFLKDANGGDQLNKSDLFRACKVLSIADFQTPQTFDIGNNYRRMMFASSGEVGGALNGGQGSVSTALRSFPTDIIGALARKYDEESGSGILDVLNAFLADFGIKQLNDMMSPFVSLSSVEMSTTEQQAFLDFYNGTIEIKLHDVKMMPIIQAIFEPSRVLARITYGWTHPDNSTITGAIMNLKNTIDVTISNYTINFDSNMEATIKLKFISNAVDTFNRQTFLRNNAPRGSVTNGSGIRDKLARLERILLDVRRQRDSVLQRIGPASEVNSNARTAIEASTDVQSFIKLAYNEDFDAANVDLSDTRIEGGGVASGNVAVVLGLLQEALGIAKSVSESYSSIATEIIEEIWRNGSVAALRQRAETTQNYALSRITSVWNYSSQSAGQDRIEIIKRSLGQSRSAQGFETDYAPLSEILNKFIFSPLYDGSPEGMYSGPESNSTGSEASTVIYFRASTFAGLFAGCPVGSFLVSKPEFTKIFEKYIKETGRIDITVSDLISSLFSDLFTKRDNINYGFGVFLDGEGNFRSDSLTLEGISNKINSLGLDPSTARNVASLFSFNQDGKTSGLNLSTINPKIICVDRRTFRRNLDAFVETNVQTDPFLNNANLLDAPSSQIFIVYDDNDDENVRSTIENQMLKEFSMGLIDQEMTDEAKIKLKKGLARRLFPTIHLRRNETSIVTDVSVTIGEVSSELETILITQQDYASKGGLYQAPGVSSVNPDIPNYGNPFFFSRIPEVSVTTLGLPRIQLHQYIFVDFGSNTNLDNIYFVLPNGLSHKIDASGFTTSFKLQYIDSFGAGDTRGMQLDSTYGETDSVALGNRPTNQQESAVEEVDSRLWSRLRFQSLGMIGDNIRISEQRAQRYMRRAPAGGTWSNIQWRSLGMIGDHMRVGRRASNSEPMYADPALGNADSNRN